MVVAAKQRMVQLVNVTTDEYSSISDDPLTIALKIVQKGAKNFL